MFYFENIGSAPNVSLDRPPTVKISSRDNSGGSPDCDTLKRPISTHWSQERSFLLELDISVDKRNRILFDDELLVLGREVSLLYRLIPTI
jgi:hypothetical protein